MRKTVAAAVLGVLILVAVVMAVRRDSGKRQLTIHGSIRRHGEVAPVHARELGGRGTPWIQLVLAASGVAIVIGVSRSVIARRQVP